MARPPSGGSDRRRPPARSGRGGDRPGTASSRSASSRPVDDSPRRPPAPRDPELPDGLTWQDLDGKARQELRSLPKELAERVGAQLAAAGLAVDEDPDQALAHAQCARRLASRVAITREALGVAAYAAGSFELALSELRAYRRMSGDDQHLPLMVDCERALGRPERALELAASPGAQSLDVAGRRELRIVMAGARRDRGEFDAALLLLEGDSSLTAATSDDSLVRLRYAYADTLRQAGRDDDARQWFARVAAADQDEVTDAAQVMAEWTAG